MMIYHFYQVDDLGLKVRAQSGPIKYRLVVREVPVNYTQEDVINMFKIEVGFYYIFKKYYTYSGSTTTWWGP